MPEGYVPVAEAAEQIDVSRATMWKWLKRYDMKTYRFMGDRRTYIRREDLDKLREPVVVDLQKKRAA